MPIQIGELLESRYRIVKSVAHGGTADVFLANDVVGKKEVIIKLLRDDLAKNEEFLSHFKSEAAILACINNINIVQVLGDYVYEDKPYIVFEYIKGNTLKDVLDERGTLSLKESLDYMSQLVNALKAAHVRGIIHRDIKPLNIFVLSDGTLKLADFGIAQVDGIETLNTSKNVVGSVHYLAPEIILKKPVSGASDIYSCGIVLFEMLTGKVPFDKESAIDTALSHVNDPFPSIRKMLPHCPKEIEKLISKCVKKNPNDRWNLEELSNEISRLKNDPTLEKRKFTLFSILFGRDK